MTQPYLEITYRLGKPFAAYLYLTCEPGDKARRTRQIGSVVVDLTEAGKPIGIEIPSIAANTPADIRNALAALGIPEALGAAELRPLEAA